MDLLMHDEISIPDYTQNRPSGSNQFGCDVMSRRGKWGVSSYLFKWLGWMKCGWPCGCPIRSFRLVAFWSYLCAAFFANDAAAAPGFYSLRAHGGHFEVIVNGFPVSRETNGLPLTHDFRVDEFLRNGTNKVVLKVVLTTNAPSRIRILDKGAVGDDLPFVGEAVWNGIVLSETFRGDPPALSQINKLIDSGVKRLGTVGSNRIEVVREFTFVLKGRVQNQLAWDSPLGKISGNDEAEIRFEIHNIAMAFSRTNLEGVVDCMAFRNQALSKALSVPLEEIESDQRAMLRRVLHAPDYSFDSAPRSITIEHNPDWNVAFVHCNPPIRAKGAGITYVCEPWMARTKTGWKIVR